MDTCDETVGNRGVDERTIGVLEASDNALVDDGDFDIGPVDDTMSMRMISEDK